MDSPLVVFRAILGANFVHTSINSERTSTVTGTLFENSKIALKFLEVKLREVRPGEERKRPKSRKKAKEETAPIDEPMYDIGPCMTPVPS